MPALRSTRPTPRTPARWAGAAAGSLATLIGGAVLGLVLTAAALRHGGDIGAETAGPWRLSADEGTPAIDPYRRAALARTAVIPMSAGQGIALTATRDGRGRKLDRHCRYSVGGTVPRARFWSLSVLDAQGFAIPNAAERHAFTSDDVLRDAEGAFSIELAPEAQPGNWLPLGGDGQFTLVLRLYDSIVAGPGFRHLGAESVPTISAARCG